MFPSEVLSTQTTNELIGLKDDLGIPEAQESQGNLNWDETTQAAMPGQSNAEKATEL